MKAIWNGTLLAESDDIVVVEGNRYFPESALKREYVRPSETQTICSWKGIARYYDVVVGDAVNQDAVWYYPEPKEAAKEIRARVAFWKGVQIVA
jgi:uncharacterized protein (DUF427 family)